MANDIISEMEQETLTAMDKTSCVETLRIVNGKDVSCIGSRTMINRGMATGTANRINWKINGKRVSGAAVRGLAAL